jgi:glyoxylase-like metal-dependent hydrolase (beta-lactamase superfamily II)
MRVHHLNCADMRPRGARLLGGEGGLFDEARVVGHVLVVESGDGLVLVDTGFGLHDVAEPRRRLGRGFLALNRPRLRAEDTAARQLSARGLRPRDVRHIVATHLDVDHAGGLADFPHAQVHVHEDELGAALHPKKLIERVRYNRAQFEHHPRWAPHKSQGERWFGFESVRAVLDDILLIPLHGHSRGHSAVAVRRDSGWLLHAGDAYFSKDELHPEHPTCPPGLDLIQRMDEVDRRARLANQARLRLLTVEHGGEVEVFCAHDPRELDSLASGP